MAKDKEFSTNDEVKRSDDFQHTVELKDKAIDIIKELLDSTTEEEFSKLGYERVEKSAGEYADGSEYGHGVEENKFNIKLAGKTKSNIEKIVKFGAKRLESEINIVFKGDNVSVEYKTTEAGFFRGADKDSKYRGDGKSYMVNEKLTSDGKGLKDALKPFFKEIAKKEITYLTHTKLGVEDKLEVGTTSTVNENTQNEIMKKLTLKEFFSDDEPVGSNKNINENIEGTNQKVEDIINGFNKKKRSFEMTGMDDMFFDMIQNTTVPQIEDVINGNDLGNISQYYPGFSIEDFKQLLERIKQEGWTEQSINESKEKDNIDKVKNKNTVPLKDVKPSIKKDDVNKFLFFDSNAKEMEDLYEEKYSGMGKDEFITFSKDEMKKKFGTTSLPELTPVEKKEFFNHIDGIYKSKHEFGVNEITTAGPAGAGAGRYDSPSIWKKVGMFKETNYGKEKNSKKPKIDKNWNILPETKGNKDGFYQVVKIDPNYHPLGMPFIKPGSKAEVKATLKGDVGKMKRMGLAEDKKLDLSKKKFFTESENKEQGINKRYLITEKTSKEYQEERWKKLTSFKLFESIKEAEEMNDLFETIHNYDAIFDASPTGKEDLTSDVPEYKLTPIATESIMSEGISKEEETINVEKPGSMFNIQYKFYKKDFINESKKYILDLESMVFVANPNSK